MQPPHGFSVGQSVELSTGRYDGNVPRGAYTVLRQLPNDGADREYRVRNQQDGHERVVRESQLRADPLPSFGRPTGG
ncbi:hypothetical protein [Paracraurococcus lichenis]|uniref:Uncharacterized protein n=1 Tax=Paracraurococcus lichenis TaxID=3064888 RepID=A0ABT9DS43_9PROT|nr:hypothetical protein [Paracraurococcus sp. LOR1-02]MDO9706720.1 hypothetical protein [Paracraurococcus sp. LOR1-02]